MMNREELELAIVATELDNLIERIRRCDNPQLRALLREVRSRPGAMPLQMPYNKMRDRILGIAMMFETRGSSVTEDPSFVPPPDTNRARADFR